MSINEKLIIIFLSLSVLLPALIAKSLVKGSWRQVLVAFAVWFGFLLLMGLGAAHSGSMVLNPALFMTIVVVPLLVVVQKLLKWIRALVRRSNHAE